MCTRKLQPQDVSDEMILAALKALLQKMERRKAFQRTRDDEQRIIQARSRQLPLWTESEIKERSSKS